MPRPTDLDPELLAILACPSVDHAPLTAGTDGADPALICTSCRSSFPIRDGIPVLLASAARPGPNGLGHPADGSP